MKRIISLLLSVVLILSLLTVFSPLANAAASYTMSLPESLLRSAGSQDHDGYACSCYALAYCKTILDSRIHYYYEYNRYGKTEYNVDCIWSNGNYTSKNASDTKSLLKTCYDYVNSNIPIMIHVSSSYGEHWVTVVGYQNVSDSNNMSADNLVVLDPWYGYPTRTNHYSIHSNLQYTVPSNLNPVHLHNYSTYVYYWAAHPHYNCYKCSCGEVKENRNETRPIDSCAQCLAEYKPNASIDKDIYHLEENVTVSWDKINNATHYNVRLYKIGEDGIGKLYNTAYNITDTSYTFSSLVPGYYYLFVQTYNKYYWMSDNSDYFHSQGDKLSFSVIDENHPTATTQYGSSYYEYYNYQMSWLEALKFCERRGGHLAVINSSDENEVVYQLAKPYTTYAWLGGTDEGKEGNWYWINSDSFSYTNWNPGEPNNDGSGENCLELMTSDNHPGQWNDVPYNSTRVMGFICEYENNRAIDLTKYQPIITQDNNGKKYEVYNNPVDWQTAKLICERKGGHLIVIDDAYENTFVEKLISSCDKDEYWLGVSDYMDEGNWVTVLGEKVQFTNWTSGEPSNSSNVEDYAVIKKNSYWNDLKEYSGLYRSVGFICEYEPITVILGDADGNGEVDISDATIIQRYLSSAAVPYPEETLMNADVDGDGVLTILDATFIQRHVAMINIPYPIGEPKT